MDQCTITLTRMCNLRCRFCYAQNAGYRRDDELPVEDFRKLVDFCAESKIKNIVFTGGEPTLYPALLEMLRYIKSKDNKMISAMATNGMKLMDKDFCQSLKECGLGYIDVSQKGGNGAMCFDATGVDCFEQQMMAIENVSKIGIEFTCSIVLTQFNIGDFCDMVRTAYHSGARQFSFTFEIDNTLSDKRDECYLQEHNPFVLIEQFVASIEELNSITKDWWVEYSLPLCAYTDRQLSALAGKFASPCQVHKGNGITFDTKMQAIPCNMFFDCIIGKFNRDFSSLDAYQHVINCCLQRDSKFLKMRRMPSPKCSDCRHFENCMGGCPVTWKNYSFDALLKFKSEYYGCH